MKYEHQLILRLLFCFAPLGLFYLILTPLTLYVSYFLLPFKSQVVNNSLVIGMNTFEFVKACIAGAAYYLIYILVLLTKDVSFKLRLKLMSLGFLAIFVMNILRILILIYLAVEIDYYYFELVHLIFWKFVSVIYVALVWIYLVKRFKIDSIPVYDDLKYLYERSMFKH